MAMLLLLPFALQAAQAATPSATPNIAITAPTETEVAGPSVRRLSPEQADAAIESGAAAHTVVNPDDIAIAPLPRGIHGEIGAEIGTRGERAVYGAATVPIGQNAQASVAFEQSRSPRLHGW